MVGLEVRPVMSPSSTIRLSDPDVRSWRRMLSCQGDWPSCWSRISGFAIAVSFPSERSDSRPLPHESQAAQSGGLQHSQRSGDDVLRGEAELLHERRPRSRGPEAVDADRFAAIAYPLVPAERDTRLDRQPAGEG